MSSPDVAVREAAVKLHETILAAEAAGYRVHYPSILGGLPSIAVSETAKVMPAADEARGPETFGKPRRGTAEPK